MFLSPSLIVAVVVQLGCQLFKVVYYSLRERRLALGRFVSAGGMPSAHTAFVAALATAVGLDRGFASEIFAVSFVFAAIVIHDILRVRAAVQAHSKILEVLLVERKTGPHGAAVHAPPLPAEVGHTPQEVVVGLVAGVAGAAGLHFLLGAL